MLEVLVLHRVLIHVVVLVKACIKDLVVNMYRDRQEGFVIYIHTYIYRVG